MVAKNAFNIKWLFRLLINVANKISCPIQRIIQLFKFKIARDTLLQ